MGAKKDKPIFKGFIIALSGEFGDGSSRDNKTHAHLTRWITAHGGQVVPDVTKDTTHLICTVEDYKKKGPRMRAATKLGKKQCKIVTYEWLEDSLVPEIRLKPTGEYEHDKKEQGRRRLTKERTRITKEYGKKVQAMKDFVDPNLYHPYLEGPDDFEMTVNLTLMTKSYKGEIIMEFYTISMFETNSTPSFYQVGVKYRRQRQKPAFHREYCYDMEYGKAYKFFCHLFRDATGIRWDDRLMGIKKQPDDKHPGGYFVYSPPKAGEPRGSLPIEFLAKEKADLMAKKHEDTAKIDSASNTETETESEASRTMSSSSDSETSSDSQY